MNCYDIGLRMKVHASTVLRALRRDGVKIRHHNDTKRGKTNHRKINLDLRAVAAAYAKPGVEIKDLGPMFGVCRTIAQRALRQAGVATKPRDKSGNKNPNWRPHLTAEDREHRRDTSKIAAWRAAVYRRDGYSCVRCGDDRGKNLNAHHVEAYCENVHDRYSVDNGATLCEDCHRLFHKMYGARGFGRSDLNEFCAAYRLAA